MKNLIFIILLILPVWVFSQSNQGQNINANKIKLNGILYSEKMALGSTDTLITVNSDSTGYRFLNLADPSDSLDAVNLRYFLRNASTKDSSFVSMTLDTLFIGGDTLTAAISGGEGIDDLSLNAGFIVWYLNGTAIDSFSLDSRYLQTLLISNDTVTISNGNSIKLPAMTETLFIADSANLIHWADTLTGGKSGTKYEISLKQNLIPNLSDTTKYLEKSDSAIFTSVYQNSLKQNALGFTPENIANKVTSISGSSTDTQYPSAKLLYDQLALKQANISNIADTSKYRQNLSYTASTRALDISNGTGVTLPLFSTSSTDAGLVPGGASISTKFLRGDGTWQTISAGTGDVITNGTSTDNAIARFHGTSGDTIQNSGVTIDDSNNITTSGNISAVTGKFTTLNNGTIPYHVDDATGLSNSPLSVSGNYVGINGGTTPGYHFEVITSRTSSPLLYIENWATNGDGLYIRSGQLGTSTDKPLFIESSNGIDLLKLDNTGALYLLYNYGNGTITGTEAYNLSVTSAGKLIATTPVTGGSIPLTTKGDLLGYSTSAGRFPRGYTGQTLISDSLAAFGLRWITVDTTNYWSYYSNGIYPESNYDIRAGSSLDKGAEKLQSPNMIVSASEPTIRFDDEDNSAVSGDQYKIYQDGTSFIMSALNAVGTWFPIQTMTPTTTTFSTGIITDSYLDVTEAASITTPATGKGRVQAKTDGKLYFKNDDGTEYDLTAGSGATYTNEDSQDAVGTILIDGTYIDFTYSDPTPSITATIIAGSIDTTLINDTQFQAYITARAPAGGGSGTVTSVSSSTTGQITVANGTTTPALSIVTGTVSNGGTALATGDQIYDFVTGLNYLTANQSITLSGDVSGTGTTSITTAVADDSHNHVISNVDNLQDSINARLRVVEHDNTLTGFGTTGSPLKIDTTIIATLNDIAAGGSYTDEMAQDAVGGMLSDAGDIDFTYTDGTPSVTAAIKANVIDSAMFNATEVNAYISNHSGSGGGGTVTAVISGAGMDFETITSTDTIKLGLPSTITGSSTNLVSTTSHSHAITDAVADGTTQGVASFTAADFNDSGGNISIDYTNGQSAGSGAKGFLTSTDWSNFDGKQAAFTILSTLGNLANGSGVLTNNGSGTLSWGAAGSGMVYPGAGIPLSTGSAWGTSITDNSSNWNTAYNDKINSATFNTSDGIITLTQQDAGTVTVDIDGRFLTSEVDGSITNEIQTLTIAGTTFPTIALSSSNTATFAGAGIVTLGQTGGTITITGTEVDGSVTNEGSLSVGAGTSTTSVINSNTSGSTGVTIEAGSGMSISESGNTITLSSSGGTNYWQALTGAIAPATISNEVRIGATNDLGTYAQDYILQVTGGTFNNGLLKTGTTTIIGAVPSLTINDNSGAPYSNVALGIGESQQGFLRYQNDSVGGSTTANYNALILTPLYNQIDGPRTELNSDSTIVNGLLLHNNGSATYIANDNHKTQTLSTGTQTLNWNYGADGEISSLTANSTVNVHNVPVGKSGTILVINDASPGETFAINVYSDAGSTALTQHVIGAYNSISTTANKATTITYKRFGTYVTIVYGRGY